MSKEKSKWRPRYKTEKNRKEMVQKIMENKEMARRSMRKVRREEENCLR